MVEAEVEVDFEKSPNNGPTRLPAIDSDLGLILANWETLPQSTKDVIIKLVHNE